MRDEGARTTQGVEPDPDVPGWLFVDLDQTLLKGDLLWEGLLGLLRSSPLRCLLIPFWILAGRAAFKQKLARAVSFSPPDLPYRDSVLALIRTAHDEGRKVVLASASPRVWVQAVADHLGGFDAVLATEGDLNLKSETKLAAIQALCADEPFEYVGDSPADIPIWKASARATLVEPRRGLEEALSEGTLVKVVSDAVPEGLGSLLLRELRPPQWVKNTLVFAPLFLAHEWSEGWRLASVVWAFVAFCVVASAGYVFNDLIDLGNDRAHAEKRSRPIASGALPVSAAFLLLGFLASAFIALAVLVLAGATTAMLLLYLVLTFSYSFYFKRRLILDVLLLAGLYGHRLLTGGIAADVMISPWLLVFSAFLFLSLALVKRYSELSLLPESHEDEIRGRAYTKADMPGVQALGQACGMMSILVLCLYVSSEDVAMLYRSPALLWGVVPVMFYWVGRIWAMAWRGRLPGDPVLFAVRDRASYVCGALLVVFVALAVAL